MKCQIKCILFVLFNCYTFHLCLGNNIYTSVYKTGCYDVDITNVLRSDTATIIEMQCVQNPGDEFWPSDDPLYLCDEKQNRYPLRRAEGITLGKKNIHPYSGVLTFSLVFEPLQKNVKVFDLLPNCRRDPAFAFWGVHKAGQRLKGMKRMQGNNVFRDEFVMIPGVAKVCGKIEDYKATDITDTLVIYVNSHDDQKMHLQNYKTCIDSEGTFEFDFPLENTMWLYIYGKRVYIPLIATPDDVLTLSISHWGEYDVKVDYKSAKGYDIMSNLMKAAPSFTDTQYYLTAFKKIRPAVLDKELSQRKYNNEILSGYLTWKYNLSEVESHLLLLSMNSSDECIAMQRLDRDVSEVFLHEKGKSYRLSDLEQLQYMPEVVQSYGFLKEINPHDYSYMVVPDQSLLNGLAKLELIGFSWGREQKLKALERFLGLSLDEEWRKRICF